MTKILFTGRTLRNGTENRGLFSKEILYLIYIRIKLLAAFSRDQEQKIYVYHKIKEHKKELATLILENKK